MAAKTWEKDFRYRAMQASVKKFEPTMPEDLYEIQESFCVPVGERPVSGWTPGKTFLLAIVLGFALLLGGVLILSAVDEEAQDIKSTVLTTLAVCCSLSGIAMFFVPLMFDRKLVAWCTGERGSELLQTGGEILTAEISDSNPAKQKIEIDGDDYVLMKLDSKHRRLQIEGISARYQILRDDVVSIDPFLFMNYLGAVVDYRIDDTTRLKIAVARVSTLYEVTRQIPILFFVRKKIKNRILVSLNQWYESTGT